MDLKEFAIKWRSVTLSGEDEKLSLLKEFLAHRLDETYLVPGKGEIKLREMFENAEWHGYLLHVGNNLAEEGEKE